MPLQNRVTPTGEIISTAARGTFMGNRGLLHDENRRLVRTSRLPAWLICLLEFNGRHREVMAPRRYTELFFLDEAVALAAGHRPCAECRRPSYRAYLDAANVGEYDPITGAKDLDGRLGAARTAPHGTAALATLPDGVFVSLADGDPRLLWQGALHRWTPEGYVDRVATAGVGIDRATVLTPALSVRALRNGYPVAVHPSVESPPSPGQQTR